MEFSIVNINSLICFIFNGSKDTWQSNFDVWNVSIEILIHAFTRKVTVSGNSITLWPIIFQILSQCILPHWLSRVDSNSNGLALFHYSKHHEKKPRFSAGWNSFLLWMISIHELHELYWNNRNRESKAWVCSTQTTLLTKRFLTWLWYNWYVHKSYRAKIRP